jgi:glycine cleavage system H protein
MNTPEDLKYTKTDEWVKVESKIATIGITEYAQDKLSDIVLAEIVVSVGDILVQGKVIAAVESAKAAADVTSPLSGKVLEVNEVVAQSPEFLNSDPYGRAWLIKIEINRLDELNGLLDAGSYREFRKE